MIKILKFERMFAAGRGLTFSAIFSTGLVVLGVAPIDSKAGEYDEYMGEVISTAGNFCPRGTQVAMGIVVPASENKSMVSYLGTIHGGHKYMLALPMIHYNNEHKPKHIRWCVVLASGGLNPSPTHTTSSSGYAGEISLFGGACPGGWQKVSTKIKFPDRVNHYETFKQDLFNWCRRATAGVYGESIYLGQMNLIEGDTCPKNTLAAEGQLLKIQKNVSLFQLLSVTYGGDGRDTFGLPNEPSPAAGMKWCITTVGLFPNRN